MNNWKLILDTNVLVDPIRGTVVFFNPEIKKTTKLFNHIKSLNTAEAMELQIPNKNLSLKIEDESLYVQSSGFPTQDWYKVRGLEREEIFQILLRADIKKGLLEGPWSVAYSTKADIMFTFFEENSVDYQKAEKEMNRRVVCDISKKTKKWEVGHKYETPTDTIIYLGEVKHHKTFYSKTTKTYKADGSFSKSPQGTLYMILRNLELPGGIQNISEVFKSFKILEDIEFVDKLGLGIDCGEVLKNDLKDLSQVFPETLKTSSLYQNLFFMSMSIGDSVSIGDPSNKTSLVKMIKEKAAQYLIKYIDTSTSVCYGSTIASGMDLNSVKNSLMLGCLYSKDIIEENIHYHKFYNDLVKELTGEEMKKFLADAYKDFQENSLKIYKNQVTVKEILGNEFYKTHFKSMVLQQLTSAGPTLEKILGDKDVPNFIKEIHPLITKSYGKCYSKGYSRDKIGKDQIGINYTIRLQDIYDYYQGNIPMDIENYLVNHKIKEIIIDTIEGHTLV